MRRIRLLKRGLTSCVEKVKCARRFEKNPYVSKLGGRSFVSSTSRRAHTKGWLRGQDVAHRAFQELSGRRCLKRSTARSASKRGPISRRCMVGPSSLAPHDERARKNGYENNMRRIGLSESFADVAA